MRSVCIRTGNLMNVYYVRMLYNTLNAKSRRSNAKVKIKPLSNRKAAELGSEIIAESCLTMIPITFLVIALNRKYKEDKALQGMQSDIEQISGEYDTLYAMGADMQSELVKLNERVLQTMRAEKSEQDLRDAESISVDSLLSGVLENGIVASTEPVTLEGQRALVMAEEVEGDIKSEDITPQKQ